MMNNIEGRMMLNQKRTIDEQLIPKVYPFNAKNESNKGDETGIIDRITAFHEK
jgi:hypothetical protein